MTTPLAIGGLLFARPWAFALLLLLPLWWAWTRRRRPAAITYSRVGPLMAAARRGGWTRRLPAQLRTLAFVALVVALAQPRSGARAASLSTDGINIVLVVDISSSMLAEDFQPQNRLEVAKEQVKRFVSARSSDRIGLVAFSGEALTQVPLTTDHPVVLAAIDHLQAGQLEDGTAIGTAIATAANRLRRAPGKSRVMVLLTDGENNRGAIDPRTAAQAAGQVGVRLYTIGVGTEGMAPVPVGRGLFGLRYENRPVKIDEALLTEVATGTGGRYFRARDAAALQRIYEQIDRLERTPVRARSYVRFTEQYMWPLLVGLVAVLLEMATVAWRGVVP
ncbi:MAG: VWA domain-containing protein [Gemmatimonadaceae bacterium]|jgi:Ca-activated chloride channel family protein|nr:VWA domain-containing protein [Gemmatimonadaceae bacterium]